VREGTKSSGFLGCWTSPGLSSGFWLDELNEDHSLVALLCTCKSK
jgi:hypothetical protein